MYVITIKIITERECNRSFKEKGNNRKERKEGRKEIQ
jgi:hypothetical protein